MRISSRELSARSLGLVVVALLVAGSVGAGVVLGRVQEGDPLDGIEVRASGSGTEDPFGLGVRPVIDPDSAVFVPEAATPAPGAAGQARAESASGSDTAAGSEGTARSGGSARGQPGSQQAARTAPAGPPAPASIDCTNRDQHKYCSLDAYRLVIRDGRYIDFAGYRRQKKGEGETTPSFTIASEPIGPQGTRAGTGDRVEKVRMSVKVLNDTQVTFVFPEGHVLVQLRLSEQQRTGAEHRAGRVELAPGAQITASLEFPVAADGTYEWVGVTSYSRK